MRLPHAWPAQDCPRGSHRLRLPDRRDGSEGDANPEAGTPRTAMVEARPDNGVPNGLNTSSELDSSVQLTLDQGL